MTAPTLVLLNAMVNAEEAMWGLALAKTAGMRPGTVYPILERLEGFGWVFSRWDEESDRPGPRRRLYAFTSDGRAAASALLAERSRSSASSGKAQTAAP